MQNTYNTSTVTTANKLNVLTDSLVTRATTGNVSKLINFVIISILATSCRSIEATNTVDILIDRLGTRVSNSKGSSQDEASKRESIDSDRKDLHIGVREIRVLFD